MDTNLIDWNEKQNIDLIRALNHSVVLCLEGQEILTKRIAQAQREITLFQNAAKLASKRGFPGPAAGFQKQADALESALNDALKGGRRE